MTKKIFLVLLVFFVFFGHNSQPQKKLEHTFSSKIKTLVNLQNAIRKRKHDPSLKENAKQLIKSIVREYFRSKGKKRKLFNNDLKVLRKKYTPDFRKPLNPEKDIIKLLLITIDMKLAEILPPGKLLPHPSAKYFPGEVPKNAKRVTKILELNPRIRGWHSTGLYAPPGEVIKIEFMNCSPAKGWKVIIGCHSDNISRRRIWLRPPRITRQYNIAGKKDTVVGCAFGGLIYFVFGRYFKKSGRIRIKISGAVMAPYFELGKTPVSLWNKKIKYYPAPFGELACKEIILSMPSNVLKNVDNPDEVMKFWSRIVKAQDWLACWTRDYPERFVFDKQISVGYMHSGYPLMGPVSAAPNAVNVKSLMNNGNWGMFHEIGHNHQTIFYGTYSNPWTFDGNVEVTVNIFASYMFYSVLKKPEKTSHQHWRWDLLGKNLKESYTNIPYPQKSYKERCLFWVHIISEFGWKTLRKVFCEYKKIPRNKLPKTNKKKHDLLLKIYSKVTGKNLSNFFERWGLEISEEAKKAVKRFSVFKPKTPFPKNI